MSFKDGSKLDVKANHARIVRPRRRGRRLTQNTGSGVLRYVDVCWQVPSLDRHRLRINGLVIVRRELLFELPNTLLKLLHLFFEKSLIRCPESVVRRSSIDLSFMAF